MSQSSSNLATHVQLPATRRLRIVHVVPAYFPAIRYGGPIRSVHALCKSLVERGHDVSVFTTSVDGPDDLDVPIGEPVHLDGVAVHYFKVPALRRLFWAPALAGRLRAALGQTDLIHLHSIFLWPTYVAARIAHRARIPYVVSPRGMLVREAIRRKSRLVKSAWIELVEKRTLAEAAGVHVTADLEAADVRALELKLPPMFCVPNGVFWPRKHLGLEAGPFADVAQPYALFLSRVDQKKGLDRLLRAWKSVKGLMLVVAGNDETGYTRELGEIVRREGIADRVRFVGAVSDDHKWALYEHAEMFVLASYTENFGNAVAEAMAMGCPVVITPEVGIARLVQEAGAGLVTDGEPSILAKTITALHLNEPQRRKLGSMGRRAAVERLSWEGVAEQMESEYRRILEPAGGHLSS
jgi:glycosyltransferase involved in cell wall biosynthesis